MIAASGFSFALSLPFFLFGSTAVQSVVCDPVDTPTIVSPTAAQSILEGEALTVRGSATPGSKIDVFVGAAKRAEVTVSSSGEYGASTGSINTSGVVTIKVIGRSDCETRQGPQVSVAVKARPIIVPEPSGSATPGSSPVKHVPVQSGNQSSVHHADTSSDLPAQTSSDTVIAAPSDTNHEVVFSIFLDQEYKDVRTSDDKFYLSGGLSRSGKVKVYRNGTFVAENSQHDTLFGFDIPLDEGENSIRIVATDVDGATTEYEFMTYRDEPRVFSILPPALVLGAMMVGATIVVVTGAGWWLIGAIRRRKKNEDDEDRGRL